MAKVLNQLLYSSVVFGSEVPNGVLRLESTSSGTKGAVELVGTHVDIISDTQIGRISHTNSATRTYTLPDYSGQVLVSGIFTADNQLVYSSSGGYAILSSSPSGVLVSDTLGAPQWIIGSEGQVLSIIGGVPVFATLPDTGFINPATSANQLAYYAAAGNDISPLTTVSSRTLLSGPTGVLSWGLLDATYLKSIGGLPLPAGTATQVLTSVGDGSFVWADRPSAVINVGTQYRLPFYSQSPTGTSISESSFLQTDETYRALQLQNRGSLRFYEATVNGTSFLELKAPVSLGPSVSWTLPATDGIPTLTHPSFLSTDGAGNLSWVVFDSGTVNTGVVNQLAYYATSGNDVSGLVTTSSRVLGSTSGGVPTWMLITESYLGGVGGVPLTAGAYNQVLVSDGATNFRWETAVNITGEVLSGAATYLAYYPATGTKVDDTGFLSVDNSAKIFNLLSGAKLRIFPSSGSQYLEFQSPTLSSTVSWTLPSADGLSGYALTTNGAGALSFIEVGRGVVNTGTPMTFAYYAAADDAVSSFPNTPSRVALTTSGNEINWGLLSTEYLRTTGGIPLSVGIPDQVLTPDGLGSFLWSDVTAITGKVNTAQASRLAFYAINGNQVSGSTWLNNDDGAKTLEFLDSGSLKFYTGAVYAQLASSPSMTSNVSWYLPASDATSSGQALVSNGSGVLSFAELVDAGVLNAVATYQFGTAKRVSPSSNFFNDASGLALFGAAFTIAGQTDTVVTLRSGSSSAGAGKDLYLLGGNGITSGAVVLGADANYLAIEDGGWISAINNSTLRFFDAGGSSFVGFKAPTSVTTSCIWSLPSADGLAGQFLVTDGGGNLSWVTSKINSGTTNAIPYYSAPEEISASSLLIPAGLPLTQGNTFLVDAVTGQLSYAMLVEPAATIGQIAVYTADQTVGHFSSFTYDSATNSLRIGSGGTLEVFDASNTYSTSLKASSSLTSSTALTLPPDLPASDGYILTGNTDGTLAFRAPSSDTRWEKRGVIVLPPNARHVTVLYDEPFVGVPEWVNVQWVVGEDSPYLPTYAVEKSTSDGFIVRFSVAVPTLGTYKLNWQSYYTAATVTSPSVYVAGGEDGSGYLSSVTAFSFDSILFSTAATLSSPRSYTTGGGSLTSGYIFGGSSPIPEALNIITSYVYSTGVLTDLSNTLSTARSGAAGVGTRSKSYVVGGEAPGGTNYLTIEAFNTSLETVSSLGVNLAHPSVSMGAATFQSSGVFVHTGLASLEKLVYATESLFASAATFGATDISVGANDISTARGFFGRDAGYISSYGFYTDTLTVLANTLNSTAGLSSASNSLDTAYFAGESLLDALDFSTNTITTVANFGSGHKSASSSTFQSKGLL